jgi:hypothetical protein
MGSLLGKAVVATRTVSVRDNDRSNLVNIAQFLKTGEKAAGHCSRAGRWCGGNREHASRCRRELLSSVYIVNGSLEYLAGLGLNKPAWAGVR